MEIRLKFKWLWCGLYLLSSCTRIKCLHFGESCTAENMEGICKPIIDCPHFVDEVRKFSSPVPEHVKSRLKTFLCEYEDRRPIVCCTSQINLSNKTIDSLTQQSTPQSEFIRNSTANAELTDVSKHRNFHLLPKNCGFADYDRIYNGGWVRMYEIPWLALLAYNSSNGVRLSCGGSIINEWYVLTAANCVSIGNNLKLAHTVLGEYDISADPDCQDDGGIIECAPNVLNVPIAEVTVHPEFSEKTMQNDIALLRLSQKIDLSSEALRAICLPIKIQVNELGDKWGQIAGWSTSETQHQTSKLLKEMITFVKKEECQRAYRFNLTDRQICAGGMKGTGSCISDSGGPLMYLGESDLGFQQIQTGIVSFRQRGCRETSGVLTNVTYYVDWILDNIY